ncbi:MAG: hypothetical protein IJ121_06355 [Eubacterium sp.]|nr:hypothetical protein [Eubacterium sp.]
MIVLAGCMIIRPVTVRAESGTIYACTIHPCYRHPVSGEIEDSGGEAAYATGQGMVEGCVSTAGMLEVTDSGRMYLTMRLSLVDYTSDHAFQVQSWGDSGWTDPPIGITGEGSDKNGKTWDITMEVPSEQCVVRGTMMVTPMGRSVIYYFYPDNFTPGEADGANGMKAAMVTEPSNGGGAAPAGNGSGDGTAAERNTTETQADAGQTQSAADLQAQAVSGGNAAGSQASSAGENASDMQQAVSGENSTGKSAGSTPQGTSGSSNVQGVTSGGVDKNAGLNLSTEEQAGGTEETAGTEMDPEESGADGQEDTQKDAGGKRSVAETIFINVVSGVLIGGILIGLCACIWYFLRKRQAAGFTDPDEYADLYQDSSPSKAATSAGRSSDRDHTDG